ncbi:MAG TPA: glycosyltransferase family 9 protein [Gemmatimonadaceae bacterium]|jgi:ADP-heptose:LPS heptosyltransferase|nr:glycosyltransferase family 9 protein [Gemmatimonadaceae bacterium]
MPAPRLPVRPRILIVALDNLGDLVFASSLPPAIRARYPDAMIGLWSKAYTAPIAPLMPDLDWSTHADPFWDAAPGSAKGDVSPFLRAVAAVRRARFDAALVASPQWRVAAAVAATRIPVRIGQRRNYNPLLLTHVLPPADRFGRPVVDDLGSLLEPIDARPTTLATYLDPSSLEPLRHTLRQRVGAAPVATINPFVTLAPVGIPIPIWVDTARALRDRGSTVVWSGTPAQLATLHRDVPLEPGWLSAADLTDGSLRAATALLSVSDVYLGCDSGPLHLSAALGVPVVGVFPNLTKLPRFAPQGRGPSTVVTPPPGGTITAATILAGVDALPRAN